MEVMAVVLGGAVVVIGVIGMIVAVTVAIPVWETWWLYPLWSSVVAPFGLPTITWWQLLAVNVFVSALLMPHLPTNYKRKKGEDVDWARIVNAFLRPVLAYYVIRWALA